MVDNKRKCVFIHIPKCAGNSIVKAFTGVQSNSHRRAEYYWREKKKLDYYLFSFIRNPWDRFLSAYLFLKKGGIGNRQDALASKNLIRGRDFEEFLLDTPPNELFRQIHFSRMTYFLNRKIDFIGRYENLDADFKQLLINIKADDIELPHINATSTASDKKHYTEYYNDKTIEAVRKLYFRDINLFDYEFGK